MIHPCRSSPGYREALCQDSSSVVRCPTPCCVQVVGVAREAQGGVNTAPGVKNRGAETEGPVVVQRQLCFVTWEVILGHTNKPGKQNCICCLK